MFDSIRSHIGATTSDDYGNTKDETKVIGYFAYSGNRAFCDGDACIIAGSETAMHSYLEQIDKNAKDIIKKTRFGEIMAGMLRGGAYAFDKEAYARFYDLATGNGLDIGLPLKETLLDHVGGTLNLIRIQMPGL